MTEGCKRSGGHFWTAFMAVFMLCAFTGMIMPGDAQAWPTKFGSCASCHTLADTDATITTATNGTAGTTVTVAPGGTFELDFIIRNVSGNGVMGIELAVPTGWTVAGGTANTPSLAGWKTVWDSAASGVWQGDSKAPVTNPYDASGQWASSPDGRTINFAGSGWDSGGRDAAFDDASGGDLDGTANEMGADARIMVPGGAAETTYTVVVNGIGHEGSKSFKSQTITVTVSSGSDSTPPTPGTVTVSPEVTTFVPAAFTITTPFTDADSAVSGCEYTLNGAPGPTAF